MGISDIFKSKAQKNLEAALKTFDTCNSQELKEALKTMVKVYDAKVARALPQTTPEQNALFDMVENYVIARQELDSSSPNEGQFIASFRNVLGHRTSDAPGKIFTAADYLARELSDCEKENGPGTLMQTKSLDLLSQHYFKYADKLGGPNGDGGPAGVANWQAGISAAFHAARSYMRFALRDDSRRLYALINKEAADNAITLKPERAEEAQNGATVVKPKTTTQKPLSP